MRVSRGYYRTARMVGVASLGFALCSANAWAQTCSVKLMESKPITLDDGSTVTVNAGRVAKNGESMMIVGTMTNVFPISRVAFKWSYAPDSVLGVLRDREGKYRLVPAPVVGDRVLHPKAASAGAAGWHVVFFTGTEGSGPSLSAFKEATIWYGRFDGQSWHDVKRVAQVTNAKLNPQMSSALVVDRRGLSFAFPFDVSSDRKSNATGNQGVVLVRRTAGKWQLDTLNTWDAPNYVAIGVNQDSAGVTLALAQSYFERFRSWPPALFLVRHDTGWHQPQRAYADSTAGVMAPFIEMGSGEPVVSWSTGDPSDWDRFELQRGVTANHGATFTAQPLGVTFGYPDAGAAVLDSHVSVWIVRAEKATTAIRVWVGVGLRRMDLGDINVAVQNLIILAAPLNDRELLVLTGTNGSTDLSSRPASIASILKVSCGSESLPRR